jgi:hypothetical protein
MLVQDNDKSAQPWLPFDFKIGLIDVTLFPEFLIGEAI